MDDDFEALLLFPDPHHRQVPYHHLQHRTHTGSGSLLQLQQSREAVASKPEKTSFSPSDLYAPSPLLQIDTNAASTMKKDASVRRMAARQPPQRPPPPPPLPTQLSQRRRQHSESEAGLQIPRDLQVIPSVASSSPSRHSAGFLLASSSSPSEVPLLQARPTPPTDLVSVSKIYARSEGAGSSDTDASLLCSHTSDTEPEGGPFTPETPNTPGLLQFMGQASRTDIRRGGWRPRGLHLVDRQREPASDMPSVGGPGTGVTGGSTKKVNQLKSSVRRSSREESIGLGIELPGLLSESSSSAVPTSDQGSVAESSSRKNPLKPLTLAGGSPSSLLGSSPMFTSRSRRGSADTRDASASNSPNFASSSSPGWGLAPSSDCCRSRQPSRDLGLLEDFRTGRKSPLLVLPRSPAFADSTLMRSTLASRRDSRSTKCAPPIHASKVVQREAQTPEPSTPLTSDDFRKDDGQEACVSSIPAFEVAKSGKTRRTSTTESPRKSRSLSPSNRSWAPSDHVASPEAHVQDTKSPRSPIMTKTLTDLSPKSSTKSPEISPAVSSRRKVPPPPLVLRASASAPTSPDLSTALSFLPITLPVPPTISALPVEEDANGGLTTSIPPTTRCHDSTALLQPLKVEMAPLVSPTLSTYHESFSSPVESSDDSIPNLVASLEHDGDGISVTDDIHHAKFPGLSVLTSNASTTEYNPPPTPYFDPDPEGASNVDVAEVSSPSDYGEEPSYFPGSLLSDAEMTHRRSREHDPAPPAGDNHPRWNEASTNDEVPMIFRQMLRESTPQASAWESYSLTAIESSSSLDSMPLDGPVLEFESYIEDAFTPLSQPNSCQPFEDASTSEFLTSTPVPRDGFTQHQAFEFDVDVTTEGSVSVEAEEIEEDADGEATPIMESSHEAFASCRVALAPEASQETHEADGNGSAYASSSRTNDSIPHSSSSNADLSDQRVSSLDESDFTPASIDIQQGTYYVPQTEASHEKNLTDASDSLSHRGDGVNFVHSASSQIYHDKATARTSFGHPRQTDPSPSPRDSSSPYPLRSGRRHCESPQPIINVEQELNSMTQVTEDRRESPTASPAVVADRSKGSQRQQYHAHRASPRFDTDIFRSAIRPERNLASATQADRLVGPDELSEMPEQLYSAQDLQGHPSRDESIGKSSDVSTSPRLSLKERESLVSEHDPVSSQNHLFHLRSRQGDSQRRLLRPHLRVDTASPPVPDSAEERRTSSTGVEQYCVAPTPILDVQSAPSRQMSKPLPPTPGSVGPGPRDSHLSVKNLPRSAPAPQSSFTAAQQMQHSHSPAMPTSHWSSGSDSEEDVSRKVSTKKRRSASSRKRSSSAAPPSNRASIASQGGFNNQPLPSPSVITRKGLLQVLRKKSFGNLSLASGERDPARDSSPLTPAMESPALPRVNLTGDGFPFPGMTAGKSPFSTSSTLTTSQNESYNARSSIANGGHSKQSPSITAIRGSSLRHKQSTSSLRTDVSSATTGGGTTSTSVTDQGISSPVSPMSPPASPRREKSAVGPPPPLPHLPTRVRSKSLTSTHSALALQRTASETIPPLPITTKAGIATSTGCSDSPKSKHISLTATLPDHAPTRQRSASTVSPLPPALRLSQVPSKAGGSVSNSGRKMARSSLLKNSVAIEPEPASTNPLPLQTSQSHQSSTLNGLQPLAEGSGTPSSGDGEKTPVTAGTPLASQSENGSISALSSLPPLVSSTLPPTTHRRQSTASHSPNASSGSAATEQGSSDLAMSTISENSDLLSPTSLAALLAAARSTAIRRNPLLGDSPSERTHGRRSRQVVKARKIRRMEREETIVPHYPSLTDLGRLWVEQHPGELIKQVGLPTPLTASMGDGQAYNSKSDDGNSRADGNAARTLNSSGTAENMRRGSSGKSLGTGGSGDGPPGEDEDDRRFLQEDDIAADQVSSSEESEDDYGEEEEEIKGQQSDDSDEVPLGARVSDVSSLQRRLTHQARKLSSKTRESARRGRQDDLSSHASAHPRPEDLAERLKRIQSRQQARADALATRPRIDAEATKSSPTTLTRNKAGVDADRADRILRARSLANRVRPAVPSSATQGEGPQTSPLRRQQKHSDSAQRRAPVLPELALFQELPQASQTQAALAMQASMAATSNAAISAAAVAVAAKAAHEGRIPASSVTAKATALAIQATQGGGVMPVPLSHGVVQESPPVLSTQKQLKVEGPHEVWNRVHGGQSSEAKSLNDLQRGSVDVGEALVEEVPVRRGTSTRRRPVGLDSRLGMPLLPGNSSVPSSSARSSVRSSSPPPAPPALHGGQGQDTSPSNSPSNSTVRTRNISRTPRESGRGTLTEQVAVPPLPTLQHTVFIIGRQRFVNCHVPIGARARDLVLEVLNREAIQMIPGRGGWVIFDVSPTLATERPLREYEVVANVAEARADPSQDYFLLKQTELAHYLSCRAVPTSSPALAGYVYMRDSRLKWTKRWLELRDHGLYHYKTDKGKEETFICHMVAYDVYLVDVNALPSAGKAPKAHSFALRRQRRSTTKEEQDGDEDYIHYFALSDPSAHRDWIRACLNARTYLLKQEEPGLFQMPPLMQPPATNSAPPAKLGGDVGSGSGASGRARSTSISLSRRDPTPSNNNNKAEQSPAHTLARGGNEPHPSLIPREMTLKTPFEKGSLLANEALRDQGLPFREQSQLQMQREREREREQNRNRSNRSGGAVGNVEAGQERSTTTVVSTLPLSLQEHPAAVRRR